MSIAELFLSSSESYKQLEELEGIKDWALSKNKERDFFCKANRKYKEQLVEFFNLFGKPHFIMKKLVLLIILSFLTTACAKKVDFNEGATLDKGVKNPDSKELKCGDPPFIAEYTNVDSKFGTLEVNNKGVCKVTVRISEDVGGGRVREISSYDVETGIGNITTFPMTEKKKLTITFTCAASTATGGCIFSYKFSTGVEAKTPTKEFLAVDPSPQVTPQGQTTGNMCITQPGKESVVKVVSNKLTSGEIKVTFTAQSNCKCDPFKVYAEPADPDKKKSKEAKAGPDASDNGFVIVPAGKETKLKVSCGAGSLTTETCKGVVKDIQISITTK